MYLKKDDVLIKVFKAPTNRFTFKNLKPATLYTVAISAVANKEGPKGDASFRTLAGGMLNTSTNSMETLKV